MGEVIAVSRAPRHEFHKLNEDAITLIEGLGVEGDAHAGVTVKHRSRRRTHPDMPNLRQVHLIHCELLAELELQGFEVAPGEIGENVTTRGVDLLALPRGTRVKLGGDAVVELTGLRNPCSQLDGFQDGLMQAVLDRDDEGQLVRKSGVMGVVVAGGVVQAGDEIAVVLPDGPHEPLQPV